MRKRRSGWAACACTRGFAPCGAFCPKNQTAMQKLALPAFLLGLALAAGLIVWQGLDSVAAAFGHAGLRLLWLGPFFLISLVLASTAWRVIFPIGTRPRTRYIFTATWLGMSINWLLPVAQIGGEIAKAVWLARRAKPPALVVATVLVDKALQAATQAFIALIGVALLLAVSSDTTLVPLSLAFALPLLVVVAVFLMVQKHGLFARLAGIAEQIYRKASVWRGLALADSLDGLVGTAANLDEGIREACSSLWRIGLSVVFRLLSRLVLAGEVWLILVFLGHPVSVVEALMIECLAQMARSAAFAVPGAYGIQETAFILVGSLVGIPADIALTVSLSKRVRELIVGLPALVFLQISEGVFRSRSG